MMYKPDCMNQTKLKYMPGTEVILNNMQGENLPAGLRGVITKVDDINQIHVNWENGSTLALIEELDDFTIII